MNELFNKIGTFQGQGTFRTHITLPNILKEFNPQLIGYVQTLFLFSKTERKFLIFQQIFISILIFRYSLKDAFSVDRDAQLNLAENIATTSDMPYMAYKLLRRMRLDRRCVKIFTSSFYHR